MGQGPSIEKAIPKTRGDIIILMDCDGEHDPRDIKKFLKALEENDAVFGRRPKIPRISERMLSRISERKGIGDLFNGFVAFRRKAYDRIGYYEKRRTYGAEFKLNLANSSKTGEVVIRYKKRQNTPRLGGTLKANMKILGVFPWIIAKTL
jgi:glycosyltransferase involved in cell wall biosynthesis